MTASNSKLLTNRGATLVLVAAILASPKHKRRGVTPIEFTRFCRAATQAGALPSELRSEAVFCANDLLRALKAFEELTNLGFAESQSSRSYRLTRDGRERVEQLMEGRDYVLADLTALVTS